jgi:hypothetical protein
MITPDHITTEGLDQQTADTTTRGAIDTESARERENHDQPKRELRNSLCGFRALLGFLINCEDIPKVVC